jgi:hypothetical protein
VSADITAWFRSEEYEAWSGSMPERRFYEDSSPEGDVQQGLGAAGEDPTGRPPVTGKGAAREEEVARQP